MARAGHGAGGYGLLISFVPAMSWTMRLTFDFQQRRRSKLDAQALESFGGGQVSCL